MIDIGKAVNSDTCRSGIYTGYMGPSKDTNIKITDHSNGVGVIGHGDVGAMYDGPKSTWNISLGQETDAPCDVVAGSGNVYIGSYNSSYAGCFGCDDYSQDQKIDTHNKADTLPLAGELLPLRNLLIRLSPFYKSIRYGIQLITL